MFVCLILHVEHFLVPVEWVDDHLLLWEPHVKRLVAMRRGAPGGAATEPTSVMVTDTNT